MTTPPAQNPPRPGWWPDPDAPADRLRYFDGIVWTGHTTSLGPASRPADPAPREVPPPVEPPRPASPGAAVPAGPTTHSPDGRLLATYGQRVAAWLVDGILKVALSLLLGGWAVYLAVRPQLEQVVADARAGRSSSLDPFSFSPDLRWMTVYAVIQALIGLGYSTFWLTRQRQATPGKRVMSLEVARLDGHRIDAVTAARRYAIPFVNLVSGGVPYLSSLVFGVWCLDHLVPLWDPRRQALHDRLAGTQVVWSERR